MDTATVTLLSIAGFFVLAIIITGGILLFWMPRKKVAQVQVAPDEPFELACFLPDDRPHKLWVRWSAAYLNEPEQGIGFGITFDLHGKVGNELLIDRPLGVGGIQPPGVTVVRGPLFGVIQNKRLDRGSTAASKVLLELGPRPRNSDVVIRGTVRIASGTTLKKLKLWIGR